MTAGGDLKPEPPCAVAIRIRLSGNEALGPGKVRLMELIGEHGSIAAAGRAMGMSYRRAWMLADNLNSQFLEPVIVKQTGGSRGGGATLTELGRDVVARYRNIERTLMKNAAADIAKLQAASRAKKAAK